MADSRLLLDVGGTFIKCSDSREIPVNSAGTREEIIASLREAVGSYSDVAVAIPGPFDYEKGIFLMKHKFEAVYGESFASLSGSSAHFCFEHDVIAMLRGEMASGNARGFERVALVTLGTGLGFAMSIDGTILRNATGSPGLSIFNRPFQDGILEDFASKRGILRLYGAPFSMTVKEIADEAHCGAPLACTAFRKMGSIIGETIAPILSEYGVECLLFGGQISRSADLFLPSIRHFLPDSVRFCGAISDISSATFNGLQTL